MKKKYTIESRRAVFDPETLPRIGSGGEGRILAVPGGAEVVKIYSSPPPTAGPKLRAMLANPPRNPTAHMRHPTFAWPTDIVLDESGTAAGFVMPRVTGTKLIINVYHPQERMKKSPGFNYQYLHSTARNLASAFEAIHAGGHVVGDVNESNVLVSPNSMITLVDTDSFQIRNPASDTVYRCIVGKEEYTPPELVGKTFHAVDRDPTADRFGLAVLIHQLLFEGAHPFAGVFLGREEASVSKRIASGYYPHATWHAVPVRPAPTALPSHTVHPSIASLFAQCFEAGHHDPAARPDPRAWRKALEAAEAALRPCSVNPNHLYGSHLPACPWCARAQQLGRDSFPAQGAPRHRPVAAQGTIAPPASAIQPQAPTPWPRPVSTVPSQTGVILPPSPTPGARGAPLPPARRSAGVAFVMLVVLLIVAILAYMALRPVYRGAGDACRSSVECAGALLCVNGHCRSRRLSAGEWCDTTSDCLGGRSCVGSHCAAGVGHTKR